jgi:hypothetical protein
MSEIENDEKLKYGQFVELLNTMRGKDLITARMRREYDRKWRDDPDHRYFILEELELLMNEHTEKLMSENESP